MEQPETRDDYDHGQMMGMLVIIHMLEIAEERGTTINPIVLNNIKGLAVSDLAEFLSKPEEDVHLLVEQQLKEIS